MQQSQQKRMLDEPMKTSDTFESDGALEGLRETKKLAQEADMRLNEAMSTRKVSDIYTEVNTLNEMFNQELKLKDKSIELLKVELEKANQELLEKDASLDKSKEELGSMKSFESKALSLFAESEQRLQELDIEIEHRKKSEKKMFDSFSAQTKELEQTKMQLAESKLEIDSLRLKLKKLEGSSQQKLSALDDVEEDVVRPQESEKNSSVEANSLHERISLLKNELKLATEAEENSKKALDDLALALKEVATEANQMKENLTSTQQQLEHEKDEIEQYKSKLKSANEKLDEVKKEADLYKNTSERLRLEAEDSVLAWGGKEASFVECIRRAEEERDAAQQENTHLLESLKAAENAIRTGKQENHNLRDILKQALNEANVAKEAARIATVENSQLKDALHEKQQALEFISQENENLKMSEAAAFDSIKELKRLVNQGGANKDLKSEDIEPSQELQPQSSVDKEHSEGKKKLISEFGFNIKELKLQFKSNHVDKDGGEDPNKQSNENCDSSRADPLKGSIFDTDSPVAKTVPQTHHRTKSSADGTDAVTSDDFDGLDGSQFDDDSDKNYRKKKALLRRFGDLLMRRNYHRKEPSLE